MTDQLTDPRIAVDLLDGLDLGVLLVSEHADKVLFRNAMTAQVLDTLESHGGESSVPRPLRKLILQGLSEAVPGRFTRAVLLESASGRRFYVRVKPWTRGVRGALVLVLPAVTRQQDLSDCLRRRFGLSPRKAQVALLIRDALTNEDIARALDLTHGTVKQYINDIYARLEVRNRAELMLALQKLDE